MDASKIAAMGMARDLGKMEVISQNIANVLTPGYKKQVRIDPGFAAHMQAAGTHIPSNTSHEPRSTFLIDASSGSLRATGRASDVALEGDGFFEVSTPTGLAYTRSGALKIDMKGQLVSEGGFQFATETGAAMMANVPFSVDAQGAIKQDGRVVGRLKIVQFSQASQMVAIGGGLYGQGGATLATNGSAPVVRSGFLENSNVNSTQEMIRMTETVRHFEAMQKIMQGADETLEKTIRKLGEF